MTDSEEQRDKSATKIYKKKLSSIHVHWNLLHHDGKIKSTVPLDFKNETATSLLLKAMCGGREENSGFLVNTLIEHQSFIKPCSCISTACCFKVN